MGSGAAPGLVEPYDLVDDPDVPWSRRVQWAEARLQIPGWPRGAPPSLLRGAVCSALERALTDECSDRWSRLHVDWHNHAEGGALRTAAPRVLYRTREGPTLWLWGERTPEHVGLLMRHLSAVRLPGGDVLPVEGVDLSQGATDVRVRKQHWHRYDLVTPLFPGRVAYGRRPRDEGARPAWAGQAFAGCIRSLAAEVGLDLRDDLHVHVERYRDERVEWRRTDGRGESAWGFRAVVLANAVLPDGAALGKRRAEGFGEVRRCR